MFSAANSPVSQQSSFSMSQSVSQRHSDPRHSSRIPFPHSRTVNLVSPHYSHLHHMLPRQCLLHRLRYPSLLGHPSPQHGAWEEEIYPTGDVIPRRCHLDRGPRLRLPPTKSHQVLSRLMSSELHRGSLFPWDPFCLCMGFGEARVGWGCNLAHLSYGANHRRMVLG